MNPRFKIKEDVLFRSNPDGTLSILKLSDDDNYYVVSGKAVEIWPLIDSSRGFDEILNDFSKQIDKDKESVRTKTKGFLDDLLNEGLVEVV